MKYRKQGGSSGGKSKPHKAPPVDKRQNQIVVRQKPGHLKPRIITLGKENLPDVKNSATKFRTYIHVAAPEFRAEAARQARSLLLASAPRLKIPKISTKGNQGLLVDASLRDIYVLAHGLRCADDIMVQVGRPQHKVGSFNRFIQHLAKLPLHAFAPRILPKETAHIIGKQSKAQVEYDALLNKLSELPLLHNNIRILTNRSILSNQKTLKQFTIETVRKLLSLRRGQSLKRRNVKYTDNPALFGKGENEIEQALVHQADERYLKHQQFLHQKQAKLLESNLKREKHINQLFGAGVRTPNDTTNSLRSKNDKKKNTLSTNLDDDEQDALYSHGADVDNDELQDFVARRTKHFKSLGIDYDPEQDPAVQDFLDNQEYNADYAADDDDIYTEDGEFGGEETPINDGMSVNYNDYIGPDGQLDRDAFNKALNNLLQSQGLSIDDLEDTSMNTVLDKVEDQVALNKKKQELEANGKFLTEDDNQEIQVINATSKKNSTNQATQNLASNTNLNTTTTTTPQRSFDEDELFSDVDYEEDVKSMELSLRTGQKTLNPSQISDFDDFSTLLKAQNHFTPETIKEATILADKISFLKNEVKKQAVIRSDFTTLRRLQIDEEHEQKEQNMYNNFSSSTHATHAHANTDISTNNTQIFQPKVRKALDMLQDHEDQIRDVRFLSRLHKTVESSPTHSDHKTPSTSSTSKDTFDNEYDDEDFDNFDDNKLFKLPPNKHNMVVDRLMTIQTKLQQETDSDFYIQTLAKYGETPPLEGMTDDNSIASVFQRYKSQFSQTDQISPESTSNSSSRTNTDHVSSIQMMKQHNQEKETKFAQTRLRERPRPAEHITPSSETQNDIGFDAKLPNTAATIEGDESSNTSKLSAFDDSDVEFPSDYTEGEGIEHHQRSQRQVKGFKAKSPSTLQAEKEKKKTSFPYSESFENSAALDIDETLSPMEQLDLALDRIAEGIKNQKQPKTHIILPDGSKKRLLTPSLLAVAWSNVGKRGTNASKRILATAKQSAPTIYTFLPPEYRGLNRKKLERRSIYDMYLREHLQRAEVKVQSMTERLKKKDAKVRRDLKNSLELSPDLQPALMIPFRPHSDIPHSCMTISLRHNTMRVSLSAVGARHQALYKRGYRTHLIETSLRESIANGVLGVAYNVMTPISAASPLIKLETENKYLQPIRSSLLYLAKDVRIGYNPEELKGLQWTAEQEYLQQKFLENAVTILGEEQTQQQLLSALLETRRDVLSNPGVLNEVLNNTSNPDNIKKHNKKFNKKRIQPLSTNLIEDVIEKMDEKQFGDLVEQLSVKNGGVPVNEHGQPLPLLPSSPASPSSSLSPVSTLNIADIPSTSVTPYPTPHQHSTKKITQTPNDNQLISMPTKPTKSTKPTTKKDIVDSFKLKSTDVMAAIANIPVYYQAQAAASLAAGLPFDQIAPLPSPAITPIRSIAVHNRDHTPLAEVLSHTLSSGVLDADPAIRVFDPFCGSGTIVLESVFRFLGLPLQPLQRPFAFENWPIHDEYQYNAMMWEWKNRYQHILKDFVKTFGISKYQTLSGDFSSIDPTFNPNHSNLKEIDFPLFVGTDLRHKSIRASIHNANNAGINYFTHFFQGDFQNIIYEANKLWRESEEDRLAIVASQIQQKTTDETLNDSFFSQFGDDGNASVNDTGSLNNSPSSIAGSLRPKKALLSLDEALGNGISGEANIPMTNQTRRGQTLLNNPRKEPLPLTKPYLKGYTMFSNIPWGVIDEKPEFKPNQWATQKGNITYNEPVEDLYIRLGRTLQDNRDLFRDVFVLSAHQKFEKLSNIGAQRQAHENERKFGAPSLNALLTKDIAKNQQPGLIHSQRGVAIYSQKEDREGVLEWDNISTFYNNGVKTHLLKLKM